MKKRILIVVLGCLAASMFFVGQESLAAGPSYLLLRAPRRPHKGHPYYPGRGFEVKTDTYAYGWFGVKPRRHWRRSTGARAAYIQWSKQ